MKKIPGPTKVAVCGGSGYTGQELIRLLALHPYAEITAVSSRSFSGKSIQDMVNGLHADIPLTVTAALPDDGNYELIFFASPHGTAMQQAPIWLQKGVKIIDLSADFRLSDQQQWQRWYETPHACPQLLTDAVYGLPELYRQQIRQAQLIANPGCYPTVSLLATVPILQNFSGRISPPLIIDAKSGISGAGRKPKTGTLFCECSENFRAYNVSGHRHWPEIHQQMQNIAGHSIDLLFTPHLLPAVRGIFATVYCKLAVELSEVQDCFEQHYAQEPFVSVLPQGSYPQLSAVARSNRCLLALHKPYAGDYLIILAVIDNLGKGAAGQAVQNMNILCGWEESAGLH